MQTISTPHAPSAIGPYAQAQVIGDFVFTSGQIPLDPKTMQVSGNSITEQTQLALSNLKAVLEAAGTHPGKVVKTTVFLKNMEHFTQMNEVYAAFFESHKPARSCVEVARLPKDVLFEIECIASLT